MNPNYDIIRNQIKYNQKYDLKKIYLKNLKIKKFKKPKNNLMKELPAPRRIVTRELSNEIEM